MSFCSQCGKQMEDENVFCTSCGFQRGGDLRGINAVPQATFNLTEITNIILGMITTPASSIKSSITTRLQNSIILSILIVLVYGLLSIWAMNSEILSEYTYNSMNPNDLIFGQTILLMIVVITALFLGMWLVGRFLFKAKATPIEYFNIAVASQVPMVCAIVIGLILSYISFTLGRPVIALGIVVQIVCVYIGYQRLMNLEEDKTVFALPLALLVMYLLIYLAFKIFIM